MLSEFKRAGNAHVREGQAPLQLPAEFGYSGNGFAVKFFKRGLVLKGINLTHAALHEEEYAAFRKQSAIKLVLNSAYGAMGFNYFRLYTPECADAITYFSREALNIIPNLSSIYSEPFADSSQLPTMLVSRMAREEVKVALSGDAGDELFGGYNRYIIANNYWRYFEILPKNLRFSLISLIKKEFKD